MTADAAPLAWHAAALLAVDPLGLGGAVLRGAVGPQQPAWLGAFRALSPTGAAWRRLPPQITEGRLLGGLDLAATLSCGRPVAERGLLAEVDGGTLVVPMAERLMPSTASHIASALDHREIVVERDGIGARVATRFAVVAFDEGIGDEAPPPGLLERMAFLLRLEADSSKSHAASVSVDDVRRAQSRLASVEIDEAALSALASAGMAFGVASLRVAILAIRAAKAAAALAGRSQVAPEDAELAAALVIAPRATCLPAQDQDKRKDQDQREGQDEREDQDEQEEPSAEPPKAVDGPPSEAAPEELEQDVAPLVDSVVEATRAAIPADLLNMLGAAAQAPRQSTGGYAGTLRQSARRGRPAGVRRGAPSHGARLALVDTLRAAAPWQPLRRQADGNATPGRVLVRRDDFRVARFKQKTEALTIFVVDASGSAALHRLAEVKGAVELVLADCYVRRDGVAMIAFRGARADLVLPPTRSLVRAKRALAGLPGGGGTPLASAIDVAALIADGARRKGQMALVVLLTDGKANIARDGQPGRAAAAADAMAAAEAFRATGTSALVLDIAQRPGDPASRLAVAMGARYIPLPYADARLLSRTVLAAGPAV